MSVPNEACRMKRVVILTGNHLCHNPRAIKEATTLSEAGYSVEVLGAYLDPTLRSRDREMASRVRFTFTPVVDLSHHGIRELGSRIGAKLGATAFRLVGWQNRWQLGATVSALYRASLARSGDLYIAHSEAALFAAEKMRASSLRVGVDMEDWYSEDLLPDTRRHRPIRMLRELERELLTRGAPATCPSRVMSDALSEAYGCAPPTVIYNAFPWSDRATRDGISRDRRDRKVPSIHWYSQTLGPGRGLEDLLTALVDVPPEAEIHFRGHPTPGFQAWLKERIPGRWRERAFMHELVPNDELLSRIAEHDIGFAGEMKYCRSRDLTVTNKILHYLLAGLAVVASDTSGQQEVARQAPDAVFLYPSGDAVVLAARLNALLESPETLQRAKAAALQAAEETFCWERQESPLLQAVSRALAV